MSLFSTAARECSVGKGSYEIIQNPGSRPSTALCRRLVGRRIRGVEGYVVRLDAFRRFGAALWHRGGVLWSLVSPPIGRNAKKKGAVIGGLIAVAFGFQMVGLQYVSSAKVSFLCTTYVALVPFLNSVVFRVPLKLRAVAAGLLALTGIGVISLNETLSMGLGETLSLLYNVPYGLALVFIGFFSDEETDTIQMTFYQFLTIALCAAALCLLTGQNFHCKDPAALYGLIYLVVFSTIAAMLLQNTAQRHTTPSMAALMISMESVFGFLFSVLYFHEVLTGRLLLGSALCFLAILLSV